MIPPSDNTNSYQDLYDMAFRRTLCIDFDGVLHFYGDGWKGPCEIYDIPVPGAIDWLRQLLAATNEDGNLLFEVAIYSGRSKDEGGIVAMRSWLARFGITDEELEQIIFPTEKPAAWITVDDRCFQFRGIFPNAEYLLSYKAWNKRPVKEGVESDVRLLREIAEGYRDSSPKYYERLTRVADELLGLS